MKMNRREGLHVADHVVREEPHGTAPESRQPRHVHGPVRPEPGVEVAERVLATEGLPSILRSPERDLTVLEAPGAAWGGTQEGIPRPLLPTHHRLQEKAERRACQLRVGGDGRVDVEEELLPDGYDPPVPGKGLEFLETGT